MSHSYAYTLKLFHKNVDTLKIFCYHLSHSSNCFGSCAVRFCLMFLLTNLSCRSFDHEQKQTLLILKAEQRQKYVTSFKFLHLQYKNKDPRKTGHSCHTQVSSSTSNFTDPLWDHLKVCVIFQAWFATNIPNLLKGQQLHSGVVKNCIF